MNLKYETLASSSTGPSNSKLVQHFLGVGFSEQLIAKAIKENGEASTESILESLLTYSVLESDSPDEQNSCPQQEECVEENDDLFSDYDESLHDPCVARVAH
ncbi:hypothetical protein L2E82_26199 [Cichorium intybus]|uniref:Uncharacterized protein n=1 Tax=Cichorium intybus TaxID=13427 RepID=A0ACB9E5V9_CICIN|nr:hypothetical protein L2E82_26199 [Cichorium intybus]